MDQPSATITEQLATALAELAHYDTHQSVARILGAANAVGGYTGANNPVVVFLTNRVPATRGCWSVRLDAYWLDGNTVMMPDGSSLRVPAAVDDFLTMFDAGAYRHLHVSSRAWPDVAVAA